MARPPGEPGRWDYAEYQAARRVLKAERRMWCEHPACKAPDIPIDYDTYWLVPPVKGVRGSGRGNPWAFDADHVVERARGGERGPLRATHATCNRSAGAKLGAQRRWSGQNRRTGPVHTREW